MRSKIQKTHETNFLFSPSSTPALRNHFLLFLPARCMKSLLRKRRSLLFLELHLFEEDGELIFAPDSSHDDEEKNKLLVGVGDAAGENPLNNTQVI